MTQKVIIVIILIDFSEEWNKIIYIKYLVWCLVHRKLLNKGVNIVGILLLLLFLNHEHYLIS